MFNTYSDRPRIGKHQKGGWPARMQCGRHWRPLQWVWIWSVNLQPEDNFGDPNDGTWNDRFLRYHLLLTVDNATSLDDGEKHLLAFLVAKKGDSLFVCSPDKACMRAGHFLGLLDRFVSLEELLPEIKGKLRPNFTTKWLNETKTRVRMGSLT